MNVDCIRYEPSTRMWAEQSTVMALNDAYNGGVVFIYMLHGIQCEIVSSNVK